MGVALLAGACGLVLALKALPYSSVIIEAVDPGEALRTPTPDFSIGRLAWPVRTLGARRELQPFRDAMPECGRARGLEAAACVTRQLAARSPVGNPANEFVAVVFDPAAHLGRHLAGAPGHCLTRSAILAGILLANGTPARVVQLLPLSGKGHTLVEVWDEARGWTVVDPLAEGFVAGKPGHASAVELLAEPERVEWVAFDDAPDPAASARRKRHLMELLTGNVLYPEPWLYLRVGTHAAAWPWRGVFVRVGPAYLSRGPAQRALTWGTAVLAVAGVALLAAAWRRDRVPAVDAMAGLANEVEDLARADA